MRKYLYYITACLLALCLPAEGALSSFTPLPRRSTRSFTTWVDAIPAPASNFPRSPINELATLAMLRRIDDQLTPSDERDHPFAAEVRRPVVQQFKEWLERVHQGRASISFEIHNEIFDHVVGAGPRSLVHFHFAEITVNPDGSKQVQESGNGMLVGVFSDGAVLLGETDQHSRFVPVLPSDIGQEDWRWIIKTGQALMNSHVQDIEKGVHQLQGTPHNQLLQAHAADEPLDVFMWSRLPTEEVERRISGVNILYRPIRTSDPIGHLVSAFANVSPKKVRQKPIASAAPPRSPSAVLHFGSTESASQAHRPSDIDTANTNLGMIRGSLPGIVYRMLPSHSRFDRMRHWISSYGAAYWEEFWHTLIPYILARAWHQVRSILGSNIVLIGFSGLGERMFISKPFDHDAFQERQARAFANRHRRALWIANGIEEWISVFEGDDVWNTLYRLSIQTTDQLSVAFDQAAFKGVWERYRAAARMHLKNNQNVRRRGGVVAMIDDQRRAPKILMRLRWNAPRRQPIRCRAAA